jgi:carboxyl-terminal processing protease
MTEEALAYLNEAMDYIQENSVHRKQLDWSALRQEVYALAADAQTTAQTYPAIERALALLGDHHSLFISSAEEPLLQQGRMKHSGIRAFYPEGVIGFVEPDSPAEQAGIHGGDRIERINGQLVADLTADQFRLIFRKDTLFDLTLIPVGQTATRSVRLQPIDYLQRRLPQGRRLEHNLGYLDLPGLIGQTEHTKAYAEVAQQLIREMDQIAVSGWVVDLRRDTGGNMWPMMAGVGPILGEGEWVPFKTDWQQETAFYRHGQAGIAPYIVLAEVDNPYQVKRPNPPVAVLTSRLTVSSGEFVALAFRGRPHTCSFGEPTGGRPTANDDKKLSDGAMILLTTHLGVDRSGQTHSGPLVPDYFVNVSWTQLNTVDDPVLREAVQWLHTEEGCI